MTIALLLAATITLTAPENGAVYDLHTPCVKEFLSHPDERSEKPPYTPEEEKERAEDNAKYDAWVAAGRPKEGKCRRWETTWKADLKRNNAWADPLIKRAQKEAKEYRPFQWTADFKINEVWVEFSKTEDFKNPLVDHFRFAKKEVKGLFPHFLELGTKYWWRVKAKDADGKEVVSDVRSFTTTDVPPRMIWSSAFNFRDVGGGKNADGKKVRTGLLYRGKAPQNQKLDEIIGGQDDIFEKPTDDYARDFYVTKLGIKYDLDLRGEGETLESQTKWGEMDLTKVGIKRGCFPMEDYHLMHPRALDIVPKVMKVLADPANYPVYVHCAVGSDRTGTIFAVLDGILGRDDKFIYDDFELPSLNPGLPRYRFQRKPSGLFRTLKEFATETGNMREGAEKYLLKIGVPQSEIDSFRKIMLED